MIAMVNSQSSGPNAEAASGSHGRDHAHASERPRGTGIVSVRPVPPANPTTHVSASRAGAGHTLSCGSSSAGSPPTSAATRRISTFWSSGP